jgi:anti-sigma B factor antagonist
MTAPPLPRWLTLHHTGPSSITVEVPTLLGLGNRKAFKEEVLDQVERGSRAVRLDFAHCEYIDHAGCGMLVSLQKAIREQGGTFTLAGLNEDLTTLFEITKLDTLFTVLPLPDGGPTNGR